MKPISYDSVDTGLGKHILYMVEECSKEIHYIHNENVKCRKIIFDKRKLKEPRSVDIYSVALGKIITRPITIEANDDLFSMPSAVANVCRPQENDIITVDDDEETSCKNVNENPAAVPLRFNCCKEPASVVVCVECGRSYHQNCFVATGGVLEKDARVRCCRNENAETNHKVENELRKKIIQEMDEKCEIMRENRELLRARVAALEKITLPQDELVKNLVTAMDEKCKVLTENKALLYEKISHLEKKPEVPIENAVSLFQKLISSDIFKHCANLLESDLENQSMTSANKLCKTGECSSNTENVAVNKNSLNHKDVMCEVSSELSIDLSTNQTDLLSDKNSICNQLEQTVLPEILNKDNCCVTAKRSESLADSTPISVQIRQMNTSGNTTINMQSSKNKKSPISRLKKRMPVYTHGCNKYNSNMFNQLEYMKRKMKNYKRCIDVSQKNAKISEKKKQSNNFLLKQSLHRSGIRLIRTNKKKKKAPSTEVCIENERKVNENVSEKEGENINKNKAEKVNSENKRENKTEKAVLENGNGLDIKIGKKDISVIENGVGTNLILEKQFANSMLKSIQNKQDAKSVAVESRSPKENISPKIKDTRTDRFGRDKRKSHSEKSPSREKRMSITEKQNAKDNNNCSIKISSPKNLDDIISRIQNKKKSPLKTKMINTAPIRVYSNKTAKRNDVSKTVTSPSQNSPIKKKRKLFTSPREQMKMNTSVIVKLLNNADIVKRVHESKNEKNCSSSETVKEKCDTKFNVTAPESKQTNDCKLTSKLTNENKSDDKTDHVSKSIDETENTSKLTDESKIIHTKSDNIIKEPPTEMIRNEKGGACKERNTDSLSESVVKHYALEADDGEHIHVDNVCEDDDTSNEPDPNLDESIYVKEEIIEDYIEDTIIKDEEGDYLLNEDTLSDIEVNLTKMKHSPEKSTKKSNKEQVLNGSIHDFVGKINKSQEEVTIDCSLGKPSNEPVKRGKSVSNVDELNKQKPGSPIKAESCTNTISSSKERKEENEQKLLMQDKKCNVEKKKEIALVSVSSDLSVIQNLTSTSKLAKASTEYSPISDVGDAPKAVEEESNNASFENKSVGKNNSSVEKNKSIPKDSKAVRVLDLNTPMLSVADIETPTNIDTPASKNNDLNRPQINLLQVINFSRDQLSSIERAAPLVQEVESKLGNENVIDMKENKQAEVEKAEFSKESLNCMVEPMEICTDVKEVPKRQKNKKRLSPKLKPSGENLEKTKPDNPLLNVITYPSTSGNINSNKNFLNLQTPASTSKNPVIVRPYCWASRLNCTETAQQTATDRSNRDVSPSDQPGTSQRILPPSDQPGPSHIFTPNDQAGPSHMFPTNDQPSPIFSPNDQPGQSQRRYTIQVRKDLTIGDAIVSDDSNSNQDSPRIGSIKVRSDLVQHSSDSNETSGLIQVRKDLIQTSESLGITPGQIQVRRDLVQNEPQTGGQITVRKDLISVLKIRSDLLPTETTPKIAVRKDLVQLPEPSHVDVESLNSAGMVGSIKVRQDLQVPAVEIDENPLNLPLNLSLETRSETSENNSTENASSSQQKNKKYLKVRKDLVTACSSICLNNEIAIASETAAEANASNQRWSLKVRKDLHIAVEDTLSNNPLDANQSLGPASIESLEDTASVPINESITAPAEDGVLLPHPIIPTTEDNNENVDITSEERAVENAEDNLLQSEFEDDEAVVKADASRQEAKHMKSDSKKWSIKVRTDLIDSQKSDDTTCAAAETEDNNILEPEVSDTADVESETTQTINSTGNLEDEQIHDSISNLIPPTDIHFSVDVVTKAKITKEKVKKIPVERKENDTDYLNEVSKNIKLPVENENQHEGGILEMCDKTSNTKAPPKHICTENNCKHKNCNKKQRKQKDVNNTNNKIDISNKEVCNEPDAQKECVNESSSLDNQNNTNVTIIEKEHDGVNTIGKDKDNVKNVQETLSPINDKTDLLLDEGMSNSSNDDNIEDPINEDEVLKSDEERTETDENTPAADLGVKEKHALNPSTGNEDEDSQQTLIDYNEFREHIDANSQDVPVGFNQSTEENPAQSQDAIVAFNKSQQEINELTEELNTSERNQQINSINEFEDKLEHNGLVNDNTVNNLPENESINPDQRENTELIEVNNIDATSVTNNLLNIDDTENSVPIVERPPKSNDESSQVDEEEINLRVVLNGFNDIKNEETNDSNASKETLIFEQRKIISKDIKQEIIELNDSFTKARECDLMDEEYPKPSNIPIAKYIQEHLLSCTFEQFPEDAPTIVYNVSPANKNREDIEDGEIINTSEDNLVIDDFNLKAKKKKGKSEEMRRRKRKRWNDDSIVSVSECSLDAANLFQKKRRKRRKKTKEEKSKKRKFDEVKQEPLLVREKLEVLYDKIDTTIGEDFKFDFQMKTDHLECKHKQFKSDRITWDSNLLRSRTRMVEIYIEALDKNITRPITLVANDSILDIPSKCEYFGAKRGTRFSKTTNNSPNKVSRENKNSNRKSICDKASSSKTSVHNTSSPITLEASDSILDISSKLEYFGAKRGTKFSKTTNHSPDKVSSENKNSNTKSICDKASSSKTCVNNTRSPNTLEANDSILDIPSKCDYFGAKHGKRFSKMTNNSPDKVSSENKNSNTKNICDKASSSKTSMHNTRTTDYDVNNSDPTLEYYKRKAINDGTNIKSSKKLLRKVDVDKFLDLIHNSKITS